MNRPEPLSAPVEPVQLAVKNSPLPAYSTVCLPEDVKNMLRILRISSYNNVTAQQMTEQNSEQQPHKPYTRKPREITMNAALSASAFDERLPTELESTNAETLRQIVASQIQKDGDTIFNIADTKGNTQPLTLSPALAQSFLEVLRLVSSGRGFQIIPLDSRLTTQQAADLLNVSRPHLIKILEQNEISYEYVGRHRRVKACDLMEYKDKRDVARTKALDDMAEFDGENGLL